LHRNFADLSIRNKILAGFGGLAATFVIISAVYLAMVVRIQDQADTAQRQTLPYVQTINEVRVHGLILINTTVRIAHDAAMAQSGQTGGGTHKALAQNLLRSFNERRQALQAAVGALQTMISERSGRTETANRIIGELQHMQFIEAAAKRMLQESDVLVALSARGAGAAELDEVIQSYAAAQGKFSTIIDAATSGEMAVLSQSANDLGDMVHTTINAAIAAMIAAVVIAILGGTLLAARIAGPLQGLNAAAKRFGQGDFAAAVAVTSTDEVGELATTFNKMRDDLKDAMDKSARSHRLSMLGQVASTVSHELRNPLGAIRTSLAVINQLSRGKGLGLERSLERAERAIGRCDGIITDMLEFTRSRDMSRTPTDFDRWLGDLLDEHPLPAVVKLTREIGAGGTVPLDGERFRQVLINLLDNAAQAMTDPGWAAPEGHVRRITVRSEAAGPHLKLSVIDTGPGIPETARAKIFEPLFTTKSFGVGLGLPTVLKIVEQHGGTIDIAKTGPEGTEFVVWLPRQPEADGDASNQAAA